MEVLFTDRDLRPASSSLCLLVRGEARPIYRFRSDRRSHRRAGFLSPVISDFAATINRWRKP